MARRGRDEGDAFRRLENLGDQPRAGARASEEGQAMARLAQMGSGRGPRFPRRDGRGRSRLRKGVAVIVSAMLLVVGLGGGYLFYRSGQIDRIDLSGVLEGGGGRAMTVLLVGSDTRSDLAEGQTRQFGSGNAVAGQRSDTIMLLRVDPGKDRAAILSLPRDLYVTIAGTGERARINTAFEDGPETLIRTIQNNFDIPIDHYAQVNFDTFRGVVDTIGGVRIPFDTPVRDYDPATGRNLSGLNIAEAGCVTLSGDQALAYVRSRHYQIYENGRWRSDPLSDLGRIQRQQDFMRRVASEAVSDATSNPLTFNALVDSVVKNVRVDEGLSLADMTRLANRFKSLDPGAIETMTMPNVPDTIGGAAVLLPDDDEVPATVDSFLNGPPEPEEPEPGATEAPTTAPPTTQPSQFVPEESSSTC